jgi:RNA polymerase sigma-70 factor (ECF subfamily)
MQLTMLVPDAEDSTGTPACMAGAALPSTFEQGEPSRRKGVDDTVLIRQAQQGNAAAFEGLVRNYDQAVLRLAVHLTGSDHDAQDIYQEAFLRAYQNLPGFRFECSFYTWIYRIVTNLCFDYLRRRQKNQKYEMVTVSNGEEERELLDIVPDHRPASNPEHDLFARELRICISRALQRLSPRERMIFELKHYHGLKLRTVANVLNTSEGTVKNTLFRATHKLRISLAQVR